MSIVFQGNHMHRTLFLLGFLVCPFSASAQTSHQQHQSAYADQKTREIKSLSAEDIEELKRGGGWGFAKAAELNGMPGPKHVLGMGKELALSPSQEEDIRSIAERMRKDAIREGGVFLGLEQALEGRFRDGNIAEDELEHRLDLIEQSRARLRFIHLSAHLFVTKMLSPKQIEIYNRLRGYMADQQ
jgi:hypothetical protein